MPSNSKAGAVAAFVLLTFFYGGLPALLFWGWVRWALRPKSRDFASISSLIAFALATASTLLAGLSILYAHVIGGFAYYDPRLLRIFLWGFVLCLGSFVLSLCGASKPNPLRWHALLCALGIAFFWLFAAAGE